MVIRASLATAVELGATSLQYAAIVFEADRLLTRRDTKPGLAYLGMLRRVAALGWMERREAQRILDRARLPREVIDAGLAAGEALDLTSVVREVLASEAEPEHVAHPR